MNRPILQHYVPRFLLREFADESSGNVSVYDKHEMRSFTAKPTRIGAQKEFYDLEISESVILSVEEGLSDLEGEASRIISKIRKEESLANITREEKALLSYFIAVQSYRVPHMRDRLVHMSQQIEERLEGMGIDPERVENWESLDRDGAKELTIRMMEENAQEIAPYIFDKSWLLQRTSPDQPFYISDNPVALHNDRDHGPFGNIGFGVAGIQIHFPLSSMLSLFIVCPSHEETIKQGENKVWDLITSSPGSSRLLWSHITRFSELGEALDTGRPVELERPNVVHHNSLQVRNAGRWIFASRDEFDLVEEMINSNESFQTGPLGQVGMPDDL